MKILLVLSVLFLWFGELTDSSSKAAYNPKRYRPYRRAKNGGASKKSSKSESKSASESVSNDKTWRKYNIDDEASLEELPIIWPTMKPTTWPSAWPSEWPTSWPSAWPSAWPTQWPTLSPLSEACPMKVNFEIALIVDNSGSLNDEECKIQRDAVGELLSSFKNDNLDYTPLVTYIEVNGKGCEVVVSLTNMDLNNNVRDYVNFIKSRPCGDGYGETDLACGIDQAIAELYENGNENAVQKIVSVNNCEDQNNEKFLCHEAKTATQDLGIDVIFINALGDESSSCGNYKNGIKMPDKYALCLTDHNEDKICVADTISDYDFRAAIDECIPQICNVPTSQPTEWPSQWPSEWPSQWPSEWPTKSPTEWPPQWPSEWPSEWPTKS
eukprot:470173_1